MTCICHHANIVLPEGPFPVILPELSLFQILLKWNNSTATSQGQVKGHIIRPTPPWNAVVHQGHAGAN